MTLMALSMFRSVNVQEKIAGNMLQKQAAFNAAQSALQYAENWVQDNYYSAAESQCSTPTLQNVSTGITICFNSLALALSPSLVTTVPWVSGGSQVGVTYTQAGGIASRFYIQDTGAEFHGICDSDVLLIDAYGYDSSNQTVAVVESTYVLQPVANGGLGSGC
jgi:type IV pilus assembly protein PilX